MENYNPRQNTRMRWKDVRELEKFVFLTGNFHFQTEVLENVLEDELYGKLYKELQFCAENATSKGVLITDTYNNALFIGTIFDDHTMQLINFYNNQADIIDINIANDKELNITKETETFISEDNVKTLFGQDITGTGDINLYRHQISLTSNTTVATIEILSSKNLKVDNAQDLTKLTNAYAGMQFTGLDSNTNKTYVVSYNGTLWRMYDGSAYYNPNTFSDRVTPI